MTGHFIPSHKEFEMKKRCLYVLSVCSLLGGCTFGFVAMSENTIREKTALSLGVQPSDITISNLRRDSGAFSGTEYYDVKTKEGVIYSCTILKGTGAAAPPECKKK
jgi:hypothetical protein